MSVAKLPSCPGSARNESLLWRSGDLTLIQSWSWQLEKLATDTDYLNNMATPKKHKATTSAPAAEPGPMFFRQILGQERVISHLRTAREKGRLSHAYLFLGPEGVGRASTARALAAALNCLTPREDGDACGACASCRRLAAGTHPDFLVIEPTPEALQKQRPQIKIEQIREFSRLTNYPPLRRRLAGGPDQTGGGHERGGGQRPAEDPGGAAGAAPPGAHRPGGGGPAAHHRLPLPQAGLRAPARGPGGPGIGGAPRPGSRPRPSSWPP